QCRLDPAHLAAHNSWLQANRSHGELGDRSARQVCLEGPPGIFDLRFLIFDLHRRMACKSKIENRKSKLLRVLGLRSLISGTCSRLTSSIPKTSSARIFSSIKICSISLSERPR